tara:strand:+ start:1157 stop:1468 length:312 start_codon:yes stop_codon:yes gene_type:complete
MVIRFPFVTSVERTEKDKNYNVSEENPKKRKPPPINLAPKKVKPPTTNLSSKKSEVYNERDMICLSNLEEVVFYNSPYKCPFNEINNKKSTPVNYDKYLDFFE